MRTRRSSQSSSPVLKAFAAITGGALWLAASGPVGAAEAPADQQADIVLNSPPLAMVIKPRTWDVEILHDNQPLLVYAMNPKQFKPYVKELRTLKGDSLLLDSPPDHVHHHGLMYAITVNGVNFWEEQTDPGVERPESLPLRWLGKTPDGRPQATFSHVVQWVARTNRDEQGLAAKALLTERRTLTLTVDAATQEVAVRWHADFEVGASVEQAKLTGSAYQGLGLRFVRPFDLKAKHLNSANAPYSAEQKWDVTAAKWSAIEHQLDGRDVMAAVFASPKNAGESRFFTMLNAFAYLSATQGLDTNPLEYKRGDRFSLDYLVLTYPAHQPRAFLDQRYQRWLAEPPPVVPSYPARAK